MEYKPGDPLEGINGAFACPEGSLIDSIPINPLSTASVNALIDELRLRFDCVVVIGSSRSKTEDESRLKVNYFGGFYTCMGMLHATMHDMEHSQSQEDDEKDYDG